MTQTNTQTSVSATSQEVTMTATTSVMVATTTEQLNQILALKEKQAGDLVASDVVREGYQLGGHPAALGFQHLNKMTSSRIKKQFPLADKKIPLFAILYAEGKLIVGEEILKKYEARRNGKTYDYTKSIDSRFAKMFKDVEKYTELLREIAYAGK